MENLYPPLKVAALRAMEDMRRIHGRELRATETLRSLDRQAELYAKGRTTPGPIVTYSRPGWSWHHYGLAIDFCFKGKDPYPADDFIWNEFGKFMEVQGFTWGGNFRTFKDRPHVQMTFGLTLQECVELYDRCGIVSVWTELDRIRQV